MPRSLVALALFVGIALLASRLALAESAKPDPPDAAGALEASDPALAANALYARAEAEDARGDYAEAAIHYRAAVATLPSFRYAAKAITRAALLEGHAEGSWEPYRRLEAVRREPALSSDPNALDALSAAADSFPPGPTRGEARMLCAEAYLARLHRPADGEAALRKVVADPNADSLLKREAAQILVTALIDDRNLEGARRAVVDLGRTLDPRMATRVQELLRRRKVHLGSIADLALFSLLAMIAVGRASSRGTLANVGAAVKKTFPLGAVFATYTALVGGGLASSYETGNAGPFLAFGAALLVVSTAAIAWGAAGSTARGARAGRAVLSATAVLAAAFLTLETVNARYLESFKL